MNKIILIGRLTKDPELRYTPSGKATTSFMLAVARRVSAGAEKEADFINIVTWQKTAENCAKYLAKGRQVAIDGRLQIRSYDGNDGQKRWVTEVIADNVEFLGSADKGAAQPQKEADPMGYEVDYNPDDIPF